MSPPGQRDPPQAFGKMESSLRSLVFYYLDSWILPNATFLCERLVACNPREENVMLLAMCHMREASELKAHTLLQGCRLPQSRYLLARCCVDLGRPEEAERVLLAGTNIMQKGPKDCRDEILADPCPIPNGAAGLQLLGFACQGLGRRESAEEYFRLSLELDPLLWVSVAALCELGTDLDVTGNFRRDASKTAAAANFAATGASYSFFGPDAIRAGAMASSDDWGAAGAGYCATCAIRACHLAGPQATPGIVMPPPPPRTSLPTSRRHYEGTPVRSHAEGRQIDPVTGEPLRGTLFGTPTPMQQAAQDNVENGAKPAGGPNANPSNTPLYVTPSAHGTRAAAPGIPVVAGKVLNMSGAEAGLAAWVETSGRSMGHLLDLGTRLGTFFPPAEGPGGPPPGVDALFAGAVGALRTVTRDPPAPWYDATKIVGDLTGHQDDEALLQETANAHGEGMDVGQEVVETGPEAGVRFGGPLFATPGLTPIHPAQQTPDQADQGLGVGDGARAGTATTPSTFLSGLLRGSPDTAAIADATSRLETPLASRHHEEEEGGELLSMGAAGAGATRMAAAGLGTSVVGDGGEGAGAGGRGMTRRTSRGGGGGGRRVGGRLSFSSAVGTEDGSGGEGSEGGVRGGGTGSSAEEKASRAPPRTHASRQPRAASSLTSSRKPASTTGRSGTRPTGGGSATGAGTPATASLAGRVSRSSTAAAAAASAAGAAAARRGSAATPMDVETPTVDSVLAPGVRDGAEMTAPRRRSASGREKDTTVAAAGKGPRAEGGDKGIRRSTRTTAYRISGGGFPQKTIFTTPRGTGPGSLDSYYSADGKVEFLPRRGWKGEDYSHLAASPLVQPAEEERDGAAGAAAIGRVGAGGGEAASDEVRLTRAEWECLQWDETIWFALNYANTAGDIADKPGDREALLASIAVRQAAHATHRAIAAAAAGAQAETTVPRASNAGIESKVFPPVASSKAFAPAAGRGVGGKGKAGRGDKGADASARRSKHAAGKEKDGSRKAGRKERGKWAGGVWGGGAQGGVQKVAALLAILGKAYKFLKQFKCAEAVKQLEKLPPQHYCTGWVQHQVGRAHFETADYSKAKMALESMQRYDPGRMDGLDVLSTTLWHLKREVELSYLAQKVSEFDRLSPITWCVVGNCFSLQKEHETALRFFQRAIQLDDEMTYAYTLCGHEYVANEDFDKAVACFRMAIRTDRRHYNAWYGLGSIYHRQEKYDMAEYHFRRALSINPQSSVLRVYLGMVLHANKRYMDALDMLEQASKSEPSNPQASFQRAHVLMSMERHEEALKELEVVRDNVPKESAVYFLMGKVCKKLGRIDAAMRHFTIALDLHNKDKNLIKAAVDRLNEPDLDEEEKF